MWGLGMEAIADIDIFTGRPDQFIQEGQEEHGIQCPQNGQNCVTYNAELVYSPVSGQGNFFLAPDNPG